MFFMPQFDYAEHYKKTTAPFAIDKTGKTDCKKHGVHRILRPLGIGSIAYVLEGQGTVTENEKTVRVKKGDVFILHAKNYHDYISDTDDPWILLWVQMSGPVVPDILRAYDLTNVILIPDFDLKDDIEKIRSIITYNSDVETVDREGPRLFLDLIQKIHNELVSRSKIEHPPSAAELIRARIDDLPDGCITLDQLCEEFHFTKQHIIRIFKKRYNITPYEYILDRRISITKSLLKNTDLSMKEIAVQLKFYDCAHLTEFFQKRTGLSPSEYRKRYR